MIATALEYRKAHKERTELETCLRGMEQAHPLGEKGLTQAGLRKRIARLHEALAVYECREDVRRPESN